MLLIFATPEEGRELLGLSTRQPEILRPQTSGPCVHYDEQTEYAADTYPCTYPYGDGTCPHLDNPDVLCPVKDACYAMRDVARMQEACEVEQTEQDIDMTAEEAVYETETPEFVEPTPEEEPVYEASPLVDEAHLDARRWTPEEERAMCGATTPAEAVALYRAAYPDSVRTDAAIKTRYHLKIRPQRGATPAPDFAGDAVPVTQCEEPRSTGAPPLPVDGGASPDQIPAGVCRPDRDGGAVQPRLAGDARRPGQLPRSDLAPAGVAGAGRRREGIAMTYNMEGRMVRVSLPDGGNLEAA